MYNGTLDHFNLPFPVLAFKGMMKRENLVHGSVLLKIIPLVLVKDEYGLTVRSQGTVKRLKLSLLG